MKPSERQAKIISILRKKGRVTVEELVSQLETSPETIRRDLSALSAAGKLQKVHGGAILSSMIGEGPFQQRMGESVAAKCQIAEKACKLISPGDTLFIDTGSTTLIFAEELASIENLTVVTNSTDIAKIVATQSSTQVYLVGGSYNAEVRETTGPMAISQLRQFRMNHAILTVGAVDAQAGIMDFNIDEAQLAKIMIDQSENIIVLADSSKLNRIGSFIVAPLEKIDYLICESEPDRHLKGAFIEARIKPFYS